MIEDTGIEDVSEQQRSVWVWVDGSLLSLDVQPTFNNRKPSKRRGSGLATWNWTSTVYPGCLLNQYKDISRH